MPGHWEGDLLLGDTHSQITTLREGRTHYVMLAKLVDKDSYTVAAALARHAGSLPHELCRYLTLERGSDMTGHTCFTLEIDFQVYFLRLAQSMAARYQREHERVVPAVHSRTT